MSPYHTPVLVHEVMDGLSVAPGKRYIDATLGGGGHSWEIVKRGGLLLGIDTDREAIAAAGEEFSIRSVESRIKKTWRFAQGNFRDIEHIASQNGFEAVDGILFDLGVSSHQLDTPERGFSYRFEASPLDLRLDQTQETTASDLIAHASQEELYEILTKYGEEERARGIVHAIVRARAVKPIRTTGDLVAAVKTVAHPGEASEVLSRVFQAIRMAINDELATLKAGLEGAGRLVKPSGRVAVISFHSLEDRIVKLTFAGSGWSQVTKKPIKAAEEEVAKNRRARSAKLRIAEKL